jgi:hypothetical protein
MIHPPSLLLRMHATRRKMLLPLLGSLLLAAGDWLLVRDAPVLGYLCSAIFGLTSLSFIVNLLPGSSYLELTHEGFTVSRFFQRSFVSWQHVHHFVTPGKPPHEAVGWKYNKTSGKYRSSTPNASAAIITLPDTFGMKAVELVDLLNSVLKLNSHAL